MRRARATLAFIAPLLAFGQSAQTERVYLSGTDKDNTVPWEFRVSGGRRANVWSTVPVPGCWEMHGFGSYKYGNWAATDEYGEYRRNFDVPAAWAGRRVFLVYDGAMSEAETRINASTVALPHPPANDRALNNSAATAGGAGGLARSTTGNIILGTRAAFTLSGWIRPADATALTTGFPRIFLLGSASGYDAGAGQSGASLALYNNAGVTSALELKLNAASAAITPANVVAGTGWIFVAVTYDSALTSEQVKFYVGNRSAALTGPVHTATYAGGSVPFGNAAHAYLLNRNGRDRAFKGWGDDVRVYDGALPLATLEAVRTSALDTTAAAPAVAPLYQWNFNTSTAGTTTAAQAGAGGGLSLVSSTNTATDLHTAAGDGAAGVLPDVEAPSYLHRGGFYEFSHEITDRVNFGATNLLEVTVRKTTGDSTINQAERKGDYWNFGGLFRPVYLESRPAAHLERLAVNARHDGSITVDAFPSGLAAPATVVARVTTLAGAPVGAEFTVAAAAGASSARLSATIPGVAPWSHEFPNRYRLVVELRDSVSGELIHTRSETIGFRTVTFVTGEGFYLNGQRVRLRGTSHHEFWPTTGRTSSRAQHIADIELMKAMGMNTVRRAHYPASREFYEETDRLGLLVLDELGGWQSKYGDAVAPGLVRELVVRDVNHPSIIAWCNGNEGGWNTTVDDDFAIWDPQARRVFHPANWDHEAGGLKTHHYTSYAQVQTYLGAGKTAFAPFENLHALYDGGGGAGLRDYWNAIRAAPNGAGLLIWAFLDEALVRDDRGGAIDYVGDAASDGLVGPFREKEASFHTVRALWSQVQVAAQQLAAGDTVLTVENRFDFTDFSDCTFRWRLGWFPDPTDNSATLDAGFLSELDSGAFAGPALAPGASGALSLALPAGWTRFDALRLTATDPHGREIRTWTWPLHDASRQSDRIVPAVPPAASPSLSVSTSGAELTVTAGARVFRFDLANGRLLGVVAAGQAVPLANGPRPVAGSWSVDTVTHGFEGADYVVTVNDPAVSADAFRWRVRPDGWLRLDYRYTLTGTQTWLGVTFDYPESAVGAMRWLGRGPHRVWKNRLAGPELAVHRKTANNTDTGKAWGYPEFRGYHADLRWATLETTQTPITVVTATPDLFLRVLSWPDASTSRPGVNVARPPGNLSLLHGINAIGHKFGDAASLGPEGNPNQGAGLYTGSADFFFGTLPPRATDRDTDGLVDAWELREFGTLSPLATDTPSGDGIPLLLKNAFDLLASGPDANASRLPRLTQGLESAVALAYRVPLSLEDVFAYVPEVSRDLQTWEDADTHPDFFNFEQAVAGDETVITVEPSALWPEPRERLFLRLRVRRE